MVDDEPAILSNMEAYFEDEGFEVLKVESGEDALATLGDSMDNVFLKPIKDMAVVARAVRVLVGS